MTQLTDETLMAFADGELTPAERKRVEALLEGDPAGRARLRAFTVTRDTLAGASRAAAHDPVPQHLIDLVRSFPVPALHSNAAAPRPEPRGSARVPGVGFIGALKANIAGMGLFGALAYSAVLLVGAGAGWALRTPGSTLPDELPGMSPVLMTQANGPILAKGPLHLALEALPGGQAVEPGKLAANFADVRARLTYKSGPGFCRTYEMTLADRSQFAGVGCRREDGSWIVEMHMPVEPVQRANTQREGRSSLAGAADVSAVLGYAERISDGDALEAAAEAQFLRQNWRR